VSEGRALDAIEGADFRLHLRSTFRLRLSESEGLDLELVEVTEHPHLPAAASRRRGFSAVFRSALPGHLPQAIYRLEHEQMGTLDLFLVPIGPRDGGMRYEAVFN
jgi:hypothetical protein